MAVGGHRHTQSTFPAEWDVVPIVQEAEWASGLVGTGVENLMSTILLL